MRDQTPIPIAQLVGGAVARLDALSSQKWASRVTIHLHEFVSACAAAGVVEVPHSHLVEIAESFVGAATTRSVVPSGSAKTVRRAAIRALLRVAADQGVFVRDPFASNFDRVLVGQGFPFALRVKGYTPRGLPPEPWEVVRTVFEDWVPRAIARDPKLSYNALTHSLSRHLLWCHANGVPLEPRRALDVNTIEQSTRTRRDLTDGSRSSGRSILVRAGQALAPGAQPQPFERSAALAPYSEQEQEALVRWILSIQQGKVAAALWAVVILGLGVGFDVAAMRWLRGSHVSRRGSFVVVHNPDDRERPTAFLPRWEDEGLRLAEEAGEGFIVHPSITNREVKGLVSSLVSLLGPPPPRTPAFDTRRLRGTWIVHQMQRGVSPVVLLGATGVRSWGTFDRYYRFVTWPGDDEAFALLRGDA